MDALFYSLNKRKAIKSNMQLKYSNYVAFSHDYGFAVNNSGIFIGCRFNLGAINKNGLSRNLTKKIEQI